jgi:hypothetical protein
MSTKLARIVTNSPSAALESMSFFCKRVISRVMRTIRFFNRWSASPVVTEPAAAPSNCQRHHAQAAADQRDLLSSISTDPTIAICERTSMGTKRSVAMGTKRNVASCPHV